MTVAVLTDSAASLPAAVAEAHGVAVVPIRLTVGPDSYRDGELALDDLLARLDEGTTTSGPTPGDVRVALDTAFETHDQALIVTVAAAMSSTFSAARTAAETLRSGDVTVLDSNTATGGQALVAVVAAEAAAEGADLAGVVTRARQVVAGVQVVATLGSLERLARSGRIPGVAGWAGDKLGINPVFRFRAGRIQPLRPARSAANAREHILRRWRSSRPGAATPLWTAALHAGAADDANAMLATVTAEHPDTHGFVAEFGAAMVSHTGPGLFGLAWYWDENAD